MSSTNAEEFSKRWLINKARRSTVLAKILDQAPLRRSTRELPRVSEGEQVGVAFVGILFGLAVSDGASSFAGLVRESGLRDVPAPAATHYLVGFALTVASFIGYYTSTNAPRLRVRFFNIPILQFLLDVLMVVAYFFVFQYAEGGASSEASASAQPEAILVFVSFALYTVWDFLGFRLQADPLSCLALGKVPTAAYGSRRWVTFGFTLLAGLVWLLVEVCDHRGETSVVVIDLTLVGLVVSYRLFKSFWDSGIDYRNQVDISADRTVTESTSAFRAAGDRVPYSEYDLRRVVPEGVAANYWVLRQLAADELWSPAEDEGLRRSVSTLMELGAISAATSQAGAATLRLTPKGVAYIGALLATD